MRAVVRRIDAANAATAGSRASGYGHNDGGRFNGTATAEDGSRGDRSGRLELRIGVAEGEVMTGVTGAQLQRFQCLGDALARAEGLQRAAAPDEIRVHPRTAAAAAAHFRFAATAMGAGKGRGGGEEGVTLLGEWEIGDGGGRLGREAPSALASAMGDAGMRVRDAGWRKRAAAVAAGAEGQLVDGLQG
jgi:hypothetical protein